jgi:hypothetical protein
VHEEVATMELIPGHAGTAAEVWVWRGSVPGVSDVPADDGQFHVVLRADDWPMSSAAARRLATALLEAAERAEHAGAGSA